MKDRRFEINMAANSEAEIWIYQEIGDYWDGLTAKQFSEDMKGFKDVQNFTVHLNSPGGNVFDAVAIYNLLKQHKAKVNMNIEGLAASAASVIAMAGDEINMAANSMMMVHQAWGITIGNADEMRKSADMLEKIDGTIINTYASRKNVDLDTVKKLVADETWMTAQEAVDYGLADNITEELQLAAHFDLTKFKFKKVPAAVQNKKEYSDIRGKLAHLNLKCHQLRLASGA
jgi:ATP-dependent Clp protease protease subunit